MTERQIDKFLSDSKENSNLAFTRRVTFQDEYRKFLRRYEIDFDERYVRD